MLSPSALYSSLNAFTLTISSPMPNPCSLMLANSVSCAAVIESTASLPLNSPAIQLPISLPYIASADTPNTNAVCQLARELNICENTLLTGFPCATSSLFAAEAAFTWSAKMGRLFDIARKNVLRPIVAAGNSRTNCCVDIVRPLKLCATPVIFFAALVGTERLSNGFLNEPSIFTPASRAALTRLSNVFFACSTFITSSLSSRPILKLYLPSVIIQTLLSVQGLYSWGQRRL